MCGEHAASSSIGPGQKWGWSEQDTPPDWETITLPPDHVLKDRPFPLLEMGKSDE